VAWAGSSSAASAGAREPNLTRERMNPSKRKQCQLHSLDHLSCEHFFEVDENGALIDFNMIDFNIQMDLNRF